MTFKASSYHYQCDIKMSISQNGPTGSSANGVSNGESSSETASMNINTFKPLLSKLLQRPQEFTTEEMRLALLHIVTGKASHAQMGSFLASLKFSDVWRKPDMVQTLVKVLSELSGNIKVGGEGHICDWTLTGESRMSVSNLPSSLE
jgi:anthranilate phosphoribosyltransferase